jgi:hypothetical protein
VTAGSGTDVFDLIQGSAGSTTISGFNVSLDHIHLSGYANNAVATALAGERVIAGNTVLSLSDGTAITLVGGVNGLNATTFL